MNLIFQEAVANFTRLPPLSGSEKMAAVSAVEKAGYSPEQLTSMLSHILDARRILVRPIDLIAYASDASFYRLIPKAVVLAASEQEVARLFQFSHDHSLPITFRAAGTSLSGQSISDGLLVEVARNFRDLQVLEDGRKIRVQPGVIGSSANRVLTPYGAKIGPDPASIATCTLGGILSNNSSGMCCGVDQNAYHTLSSLRFLLPSATPSITPKQMPRRDSSPANLHWRAASLSSSREFRATRRSPSAFAASTAPRTPPDTASTPSSTSSAPSISLPIC